MNRKISIALIFSNILLADSITLYPKDAYTLNVDNDGLTPFNGHSKHYISGLSFDYTSIEYDSTGEIGGKITLFSSDIKATRTNIGFINQIRMPKDYADKNSYPYSGVSKIRAGISHRFIDMMENFRLDVGLIGPISLSSKIHDALTKKKGAQFKEWDSQIGNEFIVNFYYELLTRYSIYNFGGDFLFDFVSGQRLAFGNERTSIQLGGTFRIGKNITSDFGVSDFYTGYFGSKPFDDSFFYYLFARTRYEYIVRNIFVEGTSFGEQRHNLTRIAVMPQVGLALGYKGFRINYSISAQSKEYSKQNKEFFGGGGYFGSLGVEYSY